VFYRSYRLVYRSQRYDPSVTGKLTVFVKRLKHAIEETFGGEERIEVLHFLRTFKESADLNRVSEGAAARLIPYFLKGPAKEGYRDTTRGRPGVDAEVHVHGPVYQTYTVDEEIEKAYYATASARQIEGEDEKTFGRRLQRSTILAGNFMDQMNLKTIYIEGLPPFFQAGLRLHVTPGMSFDQVQRMAHNLGTSLRQTVAQVPRVKVIKTTAWVKPLLARGNSPLLVVEDEESENVVVDTEQMNLDGDAREMPVDVHAMWTTPQTPGRASSCPSPSLSAVSFPTSCWVSPGGSVMSAPKARYHQGPKGLPPALPR
jgi:hypothetical protein